jgi:hypothetical protein
MKLPRFGVLLLVVWGLVITCLAWWSYAFLDLNLTLSTWGPYVTWQAYRWNDLQFPLLIAQQYAAMVLVWWIVFLAVILWIRKGSSPGKIWVIGGLVALAVGGLLAGHNAQSRDIYNYLFNAKMVVQYQADPHVKTAMDFAQDPWVRFMHNIHTRAPYGYGWTALSLVPYVLSGAGSFFIVSYYAMRTWMVMGWAFLLAAIWAGLGRSQYFAKQERWWRWCLVALNPLILMETLLNAHNDVWMMAPVIFAWSFLLAKRERWHWLIVPALLCVSVAIKPATVVTLPLFVAVMGGELDFWQMNPRLRKMILRSVAWLKLYGADLAAFVMTALLLTPRSKFFLPWYAVWFLAWLPFGRLSVLRWVVLGLALTSQLRYLPWIGAGMFYFENTQWQMIAITWSGAVLGLVAWSVWKLIPSRK